MILSSEERQEGRSSPDRGKHCFGDVEFQSCSAEGEPKTVKRAIHKTKDFRGLRRVMSARTSHRNPGGGNSGDRRLLLFPSLL